MIAPQRDPPRVLPWLAAVLAAALLASPPTPAQTTPRRIVGQDATVPPVEPEQPELRILNLGGRAHELRDGDPAKEDAPRVIALSGGAEIQYGDTRLLARNILVWIDDPAGKDPEALPGAEPALPYAPTVPAEITAPAAAPGQEAAPAPDSPLPFAVPGASGKVREIFAEGDVYMAGPRNVFQAEKVYWNVLENRSLVIGGELRTDLAGGAPGELLKNPAGAVGGDDPLEGDDRVARPGDLDAVNADARPPVPVVIRAAEIRGVAEGLYEAENARFTTSTFGKPGYHVQMDRVVFEQKANQLGRATGYGNRFVLGDVPLLYLPYFMVRTGNQSPFPLIGFATGVSSQFGPFLETRWGNTFFEAGDALNRTLGIEGSFEGNWFVDVNLYGARGLGLGGGMVYETKDESEQKYFGQTQFFWIYDYSGDDETGGDEDEEDVAGNRGRFETQNRAFLPDGYQFDTEINYVSDRGLLREFFPDEFREEKEPETYAYLKKQDGDAAATALAKFRLNDWQSQTEYLPQFTYDVISRPIAEFEDFGAALGQPEPVRAYWTHRSEVGYVRFRGGEDSDRDDVSALRFDDIERLNMPFELGIFGIDPYFENRVTAWLGDGEENGGGAFREAMTVGYNVTTQFWKVDPDVESEFWNIHGLRHIVEPTLRHRWTFLSTQDANDLELYDRVERFDELHAIVPGVRSRYQTRRLTRYGPETVTFLEFDVQQAFVPDNAIEDTDTVGDLYVQATYRPDLELYLLRNSHFRLRTDWNWEDAQLDRFQFEFFTEPGPDFATRLAYSYASRGRTSPTLALDGFVPRDRSRDLNSLTFEVAYQATRLWEVVLLEQYDFDDGRGAQTRILLRRTTADWVFEFVIGAPTAGAGSGFGVTVTPRAFFNKEERDRFQSALSDGYDLTPIFDEPSYAEGSALQGE